MTSRVQFWLLNAGRLFGRRAHIAWKELAEADKFERLAPSRKQLVDTVKMIADRAETALASILREVLARQDDARSLLRDLFRSEADLLSDPQQRRLRVLVQPLSSPRSNRAVGHLLEQLNAAELTCPGTDLRLSYSLLGADSGSPHNPAGQEASGGLSLRTQQTSHRYVTFVFEPL